MAAVASVGVLVGSIAGPRLHRRPGRRLRGTSPPRAPRRAAEGALPEAVGDVDVITVIREKEDVATDAEGETSKDYWAVLVHAPMGSCNMPWCSIPGISGMVCHCKKDGIAPPSSGGKSLRSADGKCALSMQEYAQLIAEGVPVLSSAAAWKASRSLFESAMKNNVGSTMVIGTFKTAAEEYKDRLLSLGLWASVVPVERD